MKSLLVIGMMTFALLSCRKPENRLCWKFTGDEKTIEIPMQSFNRLTLYPHIAYILVQDSLDKLEIRGGENLVNHVTYEIENGMLEIRNKNKCSFLRNAKKELVVTIHFTELYNIHYEGTEYLKSQGTIHSDYFTLMIRDGAGPVTLDMQSQVIAADISHGWGDYTLTGQTKYARISARSNGYCNTFGLEITDSVYVASETPGTIKVRANGIPLRGYSKSSGDIWYQGVPSLISIIKTGEGEVIDKN